VVVGAERDVEPTEPSPSKALQRGGDVCPGIRPQMCPPDHLNRLVRAHLPSERLLSPPVDEAFLERLEGGHR
jgi:hypothetical protein